jgi:hypothetical protein
MRSLWLESSFEQCANATSSLIPFFKALHLAAALCGTGRLAGIGAAQINIPSQHTQPVPCHRYGRSTP